MLDGRVAVVTGGSSGIGRAVTIALAAAGATVVAVGRDTTRLHDVAAAGGPDDRIETTVLDLADDDAVRGLGAELAAAYGAIDVLVHAAGDIAFGRVEDAGIDDLDRLFGVNLRAPYLLTQAILPLLGRPGGHIVFVNSSAGVRPSAGVAGYGAMKHALRGLADALRDEVNPLGIRVTSVYPGRTRTPMQASVHRWEGRAEMSDELLEPEDVAAMIVALLGLPGRAEVTDLHVRPAYPPRTGA